MTTVRLARQCDAFAPGATPNKLPIESNASRWTASITSTSQHLATSQGHSVSFCQENDRDVARCRNHAPNRPNIRRPHPRPPAMLV
ncbi:MAG TPA: hypothetical protein VF328_10920, partial [Mycobacterium sp.]